MFDYVIKIDEDDVFNELIDSWGKETTLRNMNLSYDDVTIEFPIEDLVRNELNGFDHDQVEENLLDILGVSKEKEFNPDLKNDYEFHQVLKAKVKRSGIAETIRLIKETLENDAVILYEVKAHE
jgi:hypothetical protein